MMALDLLTLGAACTARDEAISPSPELAQGRSYSLEPEPSFARIVASLYFAQATGLHVVDEAVEWYVVPDER
jgi:hypothetical protein